MVTLESVTHADISLVPLARALFSVYEICEMYRLMRCALRSVDSDYTRDLIAARVARKSIDHTYMRCADGHRLSRFAL
jgi:hypothetical protein